MSGEQHKNHKGLVSDEAFSLVCANQASSATRPDEIERGVSNVRFSDHLGYTAIGRRVRIAERAGE